MIRPETYRMDHAGDSWEELTAERARLNRSLRRFELHREELLNAERSMDPDVVYQCELEHLRELCDLTLQAMRRETGLAELSGDDEESDKQADRREGR